MYILTFTFIHKVKFLQINIKYSILLDVFLLFYYFASSLVISQKITISSKSEHVHSIIIAIDSGRDGLDTE